MKTRRSLLMLVAIILMVLVSTSAASAFSFADLKAWLFGDQAQAKPWNSPTYGSPSGLATRRGSRRTAPQPAPVVEKPSATEPAPSMDELGAGTQAWGGRTSRAASDSLIEFSFDTDSDNQKTKELVSKRTATVSGPAYIKSGGPRRSGVYEFDMLTDTDKRISLTPVSLQDLSTFTFEAVVQPFDNKGQVTDIFQLTGDGLSQIFLRTNKDGGVTFGVLDKKGIGTWQILNTKGALAVGEFSHIVAVFSNGQLSLYHNGRDQGTLCSLDFEFPDKMNLFIGGKTAGTTATFKGSVDRFKLSKKKMSESSIYSSCNSVSTRCERPPRRKDLNCAQELSVFTNEEPVQEPVEETTAPTEEEGVEEPLDPQTQSLEEEVERKDKALSKACKWERKRVRKLCNEGTSGQWAQQMVGFDERPGSKDRNTIKKQCQQQTKERYSECLALTGSVRTDFLAATDDVEKGCGKDEERNAQKWCNGQSEQALRRCEKRENPSKELCKTVNARKIETIFCNSENPEQDCIPLLLSESLMCNKHIGRNSREFCQDTPDRRACQEAAESTKQQCLESAKERIKLMLAERGVLELPAQSMSFPKDNKVSQRWLASQTEGEQESEGGLDQDRNPSSTADCNTKYREARTQCSEDRNTPSGRAKYSSCMSDASREYAECLR